MDAKKTSRGRALLFVVLSLLLCAIICPLTADAAPIKVYPKDKVTILVNALPGTIEDAKELKESGELTSMSLENEITVKVYCTNYDTKLTVSYTAENGKSEVFDSDTFVYKCEKEEDYTKLVVVCRSKATGDILAEFTIDLKYEEVGFFKRTYWKIVGDPTFQEILKVVKTQVPLAIWDTTYVTLLSSLFAFLIGLPLGVLLVTGDKKGIHPLPKALMSALNVVINILRSIPFLILMIMVIPISRAVVGTSVGTVATIIPLVFAAFPFVARLVESSLRELNPNIIEAAQSMGASTFQIILKVMIPESVPSLVSNMTIAVTTILGYSAMSGAIGGGGLGKIAIDYGYYRYQYATMIVAVILLVVLVQIFQTIGTRLAKKLDKRLK